MTRLMAMETPEDRLSEMVHRASLGQGAVLLAFTPDRFLMQPAQPGFEIPDYTEQGRIFSPSGELKWRRVEALYRLVYLGEDEPGEGFEDHSGELADLTRGQADLFLWGIRTDLEEEWVEGIPHRLRYPVRTREHPRGRVALTVEKWIDGLGEIRFSRYHSLREKPGEVYAAG